MMESDLGSFVDDQDIAPLRDFLLSLARPEPPLLLRNDILLAFQHFVDQRPSFEGDLAGAWRFLRKVQEVLLADDLLIILYRHRRASCRIFALSEDDDRLIPITLIDFLALKERLIRPNLPPQQRTLAINLAPFYDYGPALKDPKTIGQGIKFLNRHMSGNLANHPEKWNRSLYEFLKLHQLHGTQLLLDGNLVRSPEELEEALSAAMDFLERCRYPDDLAKIKQRLGRLGFLDGWGNSLPRMLETMHMLQDILEQPDEANLEEFLSRIPMVSSVALISPHGWFGQENVLGRPDTGGQVVYVLDQAKALEDFLAQDLRDAGLEIAPKILIVTRLIPENEGTTADQRLEKVYDTDNVWILRVPFRYPDNSVVPHWLSRFRIWPYLDQFAVDAEEDIRRELMGRPDLLVGNYSDGNLVATRLSKNMGVIQCNIAHALEKSKYLFSDLYWDEFEPDYNFSIQFMADLLAMNQANFIITSTAQEITGTDNSIGQYESYQFFTMPGLLNVISGINLFHPRFNVIPPGVNQEVYFPYNRKRGRKVKMRREVNRLLFEQEDANCLGRLDDPELPPLFTIARLDRIKNLTGLVEAYGQDEELRRRVNLIMVASVTNPELSKDAEEAAEIRKMHGVIEQYGLWGQVRWIGKFLGKAETGEAYRIMADRRGVFVQPALFEAFGLTILEAMHSGLPVFATQFGGPLEIIEHEKSGFLINPTDQPAMTARLREFFQHCEADPRYWQGFSQRALERARERFTWRRHCRELTRLTKVYGFWRYSTSQQAKMRLNQYSEALYHLFYKDRAEQIR
ncbi:sucrose synthase [Desulfurivibrio dismutans]|uniref:sucrose synthase n=1 Tax=Desulfurivibrio dismutans TaxID=1398908 RepID=UPI0023DC0A04|nr:sucrose synthase [Desulfurivibrio alkaliphilus]MDF1613578.1 sucrose synthase [Desulfurivibrio alkaliphilus]